jgi:carbon storage regulator
MLVLSRREGQRIVIGDGIEITVAEVQGSRVRIAISAPKDVRIVRGELLDEQLLQARRDEETGRPVDCVKSHCI